MTAPRRPPSRRCSTRSAICLSTGASSWARPTTGHWRPESRSAPAALPVDLALDPLEGREVVARGGSGAMSMIAVGEPGAFVTLPDMYMRRMAVGPRVRDKIDLRKPVGENIAIIAEAFGRNPNDITTIVLDRPRHHDLIDEIRAGGRPHQADSRRRRHRLDLGGDPRHQRSPGDRHRRHAPGRADRCGAALPRRRHAAPSSGRSRGARSSRPRRRASTTSSASSRPAIWLPAR